MFNDIFCDRYDNKDECLKNANFVKIFAQRFGIGQWSFIGPGSEKKWYPSENSPQGAWDYVAEEILLLFAESGHPILRSTTPLFRGKLKSKGKRRCPYTSLLIKIQLIQFIALFSLSISSVSTGQWQLYARNLRTIKKNENPLNHQILCQQYIQQIESVSPGNRVTKFCKEAGCVLSKLDNSRDKRCWWIKANSSLSRIHLSTRRQSSSTERMDSRKCENWTCSGSHDESSSTSSTELKFELSPWIKTILILGSEFLMELSNLWSILLRTTENIADSQEEEGVRTSSSVVAGRSKAKAQPQPRESTGTTTIPLSERKWIDIEPSKQDLESYDLSKKVINLLRHNQKLHREEDGAIQFYKIKFHQRDYPLPIQNWSDDRWLACLAAGGGSKRRYQYCSDYLGSIIYLRALQGHSGNNLIDPAPQDNVLIGPGIFPYIYHVGSNFNLQTIIGNGLVLEVKICADDKLCSSYLLIQEMKITKIQSISTTLHHVLHDTCKIHGREFKMRYFGSMLILESKKD